MIKAALFIPCYIDQLYPQVAIATLQLLEKLGVEVVYPLQQTCCGQPMANSGFEHLTGKCNDLFIRNFSDFDYIVCPSGSCTLHIREHLHAGEDSDRTEESHGTQDNNRTQEKASHIRSNIYELTEFLTDVLDVQQLDAWFPYKVGLHQSCHGQRGLHLSQMSELVGPPYSKPGRLLKMVAGIELISLDRTDECCGFGGTYCITEEAVSVKMGKDRVMDHEAHGAEIITASDISCLMHLEGILRRKKSKIQIRHIAEILNHGPNPE